MLSVFTALPVILLAVLANNLILTKAEKVMRPKFKNISSWSDEKFVTHSIKYDASGPYMNLTLNVLQQLHNYDMHVEASYVEKLNPDFFFAVNTTMNVCTILKYNMKSPLAAMIVAFLSEYGKVFDKCPINKGTYYLHNFWLPEDPSMIYLPEVDFVVRFTGIHVDANKKKTVIINDYISGEMVVQDVKNLKMGI